MNCSLQDLRKYLDISLKALKTEFVCSIVIYYTS